MIDNTHLSLWQGYTCWPLAVEVFQLINGLFNLYSSAFLHLCWDFSWGGLALILSWFWFLWKFFKKIILELFFYRIWTFSFCWLLIAILAYLFSCRGTNNLSFDLSPLISPNSLKGITKLISPWKTLLLYRAFLLLQNFILYIKFLKIEKRWSNTLPGPSPHNTLTGQ